MLMSDEDDVNINGGDDVHDAWDDVDEWWCQQQWWWCPCLRWFQPCSCCSVCFGNPRSCQIAPLTLPADITLGEILWDFITLYIIWCYSVCHIMTLCGSPIVTPHAVHHILLNAGICEIGWHFVAFDIPWHFVSHHIPGGWAHPAPCWSGLPWWLGLPPLPPANSILKKKLK